MSDTINRFFDFLSKDLELSLRLREVWTASLILASLIIFKWPTELSWAIFGCIVAGWIGNLRNGNPIFVRSYGDEVYLLENPIWPWVNNTKLLKDRIYCSLLGASYNNEVLSVRQFTKWLILRGRDKKTDFEITLKDAQIVSLEHASTKYLKIKNINILYGFPDLLTLKDFQSWVVENRKQKLDTVCLNNRTIVDYILGPVLISSALWSDQDFIDFKDRNKIK